MKTEIEIEDLVVGEIYDDLSSDGPHVTQLKFEGYDEEGNPKFTYVSGCKGYDEIRGFIGFQEDGGPFYQPINTLNENTN